MIDNEDNNIIRAALEIVTYHLGQVEEFIEYHFAAEDRDLLIAQKLLDKLSKAREILKNPAESRERELQVLKEIPIAFEDANKEKNEILGGKIKIDLSELRKDKWWSFLLTEAGEETLNEIVLGFMQEDQQKLFDLGFELEKNHRHVEL